MKTLIFLLLLSTVCYADCTTNSSGDQTCCTGNVCYETPSQATLDARATAQATADAQVQADQQTEALIQQDMRALAIADLQSTGLITDQQATTETGRLTTLNSTKITVAGQLSNETVNP